MEACFNIFYLSMGKSIQFETNLYQMIFYHKFQNQIYAIFFPQVVFYAHINITNLYSA